MTNKRKVARQLALALLDKALGLRKLARVD